MAGGLADEQTNPFDSQEKKIDLRGVKFFTDAMLKKLEQKREEGKHGWHDQELCSIDQLYDMMDEHVEKRDVVDIANFCMMIWNREHDL